MLAIVDYEAGNLRSVARAVEHAGVTPTITADPAVVRQAGAVILPGVGAAAQAMGRLRELGMDEALRDVIGRGVPVLGVCLGLQVLLERSEEGGPEGTACLGLLPGVARRFPPGLKVPHMGWNTVRQETACPLFEGIPDHSHFYFVHSYYADAAPHMVTGRCEYALPFCAVLRHGQVMATQFHPEKSGAQGLRLYWNFLRLARLCS